MDNTTVDKYKLMATLVRGFFEGFSAGIIDCHVTDPFEKTKPQIIKKVMLEHYDKIADVFHETIIYPIAIANFSFEDMLRILSKADQDKIPMTELIKKVCATEELHQAMVAEYKRNFGLLLSGHYATLTEHFNDYTRNPGEKDGIDTDLAIKLTTRAVMRAYTEGIKRGGTDKSSLHQASVYRLLFDAMITLLSDKPIPLKNYTTDMETLLLAVCQTEHNLEIMVDEMEATYKELAEYEGITAPDDAEDTND